MTMVSAAHPDVLGEDWVQRTIPLRADGDGTQAEPPVATLVHRRQAGAGSGHRRAVLYVHGFTDYFFQAHHARTWEEAGFDFYAIDLRDYGRSIRPGRPPNWITDLRAYDEEIEAALEFVRGRRGYESVLLAGHSTGGLITGLYLSERPEAADGLVLNSPWLDLNESWFIRHVAGPVIGVIAPVAPRLRLRPLGGAYGRSLHVSTGGEWDYALAWKPLEGFPVLAAWFRAIRHGHHRMHRGLGLEVPVLMATSGARGNNLHPSQEDLAGTDAVLSPPQMWRWAPRLGIDVTVMRINGGRHDLSLSRLPARERFAQYLQEWLGRRFN